MGIRFYCPNGHKLNVKENLAGKRGICPHCGIKLLIPQKSTRVSSREEREQNQGLAPGIGGNPNDFAVFADDQGTAEIAISFDESGNLTSATAQMTTQSTIEPSVLAAAFDDPSVVWYVQLTDGQRFGPATLPIMKSWVNERRISPTMLVWREGWQDWLEARLVFTEIERIFQEMQAKKLKKQSNTNRGEHRPVSWDDQRLDTGEESNRTSALLIVTVTLAILIFAAIIYLILKP
jgi:hypothetical protein